MRRMDTPSAFGAPIDHAFFERSPSEVAPDLLGRVLASTSGGVLTAGAIVEAEAYLGADDPGSHASTKGVTKRNVVMYGPPGTVYVYFTYGNHHMVNLVCGPQGEAGAVLIRALEPVEGIEAMARRRSGRPLRELANGPGKLAEALGIDLSDNGSLLNVGRLSLFEGEPTSSDRIDLSGRIGLSAGHELLLRYYDSESAFLSSGRPGPLRPKRRAQRGTSR
ncbi:MAG: DNA-3-methyladenine glycosylase [Coriobacteriales bacterium]|nr:DNA-3-methyladenine glycosylase [Coriobacteriales bacterium]